MLYWAIVDPDRWLERARQGDVPSYNRLVDMHQSLAYHVAFNHIGNEDDALDACQDAFVSAWRALAEFGGNAKAFRCWLVRIVINSVRDRQRYASRRPQTPLEAHSEDGWRGLPLPDPGESPEAYAERADLRTLLEGALQRLSDDHRAVILLDHAGFDYAEMARILDIETGTVKSRLSRARTRMRALLSGEVHLGMRREPQLRERRSQGTGRVPRPRAAKKPPRTPGGPDP